MRRDELTDTQKFFVDVRKAGAEGAHSHDLARSIPSLNVSQRAKDCVSKGQQIYTTLERRNGRPGARFWLDGWQPDHATAVRPNGAEGGGGHLREQQTAAPLNPVQLSWVRSTDGIWSREPSSKYERAA